MWVNRKEDKKEANNTVERKLLPSGFQALITIVMNFSKGTWLTLLYSSTVESVVLGSGVPRGHFALVGFGLIELLNYCLYVRVEYSVWQYVWHVRLSTIARDIRIWGSFYFEGERNINVDIWSMKYNSRRKMKSFFIATYNSWTFTNVHEQVRYKSCCKWCSWHDDLLLTYCDIQNVIPQCHVTNKID